MSDKVESRTRVVTVQVFVDGAPVAESTGTVVEKMLPEPEEEAARLRYRKSRASTLASYVRAVAVRLVSTTPISEDDLIG